MQKIPVRTPGWVGGLQLPSPLLQEHSPSTPVPSPLRHGAPLHSEVRPRCWNFGVRRPCRWGVFGVQAPVLSPWGQVSRRQGPVHFPKGPPPSGAVVPVGGPQSPFCRRPSPAQGLEALQPATGTWVHWEVGGAVVSTRGHCGRWEWGVRSASHPGARIEDSQQGLKQFAAPGDQGRLHSLQQVLS